MATVAAKPMTAQEFLEWVNRPENHDRYFELEQGEIVEMPPPGKYHGFVCGNASFLLGRYVRQRGKGYVCTNDAGVIVETDPDTVRGPDLTLYEDEQNASDMERGHARTPPLLAVEVLSPEDRINKTTQRVVQLLNRGVKMVWVVDPEARDVSVCRPGKEPVLFDEGQELACEDVLPGFRCRVSEFFAAS